MRVTLLLAGLLLLFGVTFLTYYQSVPTEGLAWWGEMFPFLSFILTATVMLVGIFFGCLFRRVAGRKGRIQVKLELGKVLRSGSFIAALCVSPFIFFSVYVLVSESPGDPASYLLAFQNGFFCESIFEQVQKSLLGAHAANPAVAVSDDSAKK